MNKQCKHFDAFLDIYGRYTLTYYKAINGYKAGDTITVDLCMWENKQNRVTMPILKVTKYKIICDWRKAKYLD